MKDTIYRDDAIQCCRNEWEEEVEERLRLLPSAERKGYNLSDCKSLFKCSVCGAECSDIYSFDCNINYCPNCGGSMERKR